MSNNIIFYIFLSCGLVPKVHFLDLIHQPISGFKGQASDIDIHAKEVLKLKNRVNSILAEHTGRTEKQIAKDTDRDNFMDAHQSQQYGLIDIVLSERNEINK